MDVNINNDCYYNKINYHQIIPNNRKEKNIRRSDMISNHNYNSQIHPINRKTITLSTIDTSNTIKNYDSSNVKNNNKYSEIKNRTEDNINLNNFELNARRGNNDMHLNFNYSDSYISNINNYINNKIHNNKFNDNNLIPDNELNDFNSEKNMNAEFKLMEYNANSKKYPKYHYKLNDNGNKIFKNNQLINNGIENKNYKFSKNIIQSIIKLRLNHPNKISSFSSSNINSNYLLKKEKIQNYNPNQFLINISPKKTFNNISNMKNLNINNYNNQMNGITNYYILNNNINNEDDEEEIYFNPEYENENNNYDSNNIYTYFEQPEIIKEVNEDMEESSSENKIIKKRNEDKFNKSFNAKNKTNVIKKNSNNIYFKNTKNNKNKILNKNNTWMAKNDNNNKNKNKILNKNNTWMIKNNNNNKKKIMNTKIKASKNSKFGKKLVKNEGIQNIVLKFKKNNFKNFKNRNAFIKRKKNNNNYDNGLENLKKYVENELNKLRANRSPNIYNFLKNKI